MKNKNNDILAERRRDSGLSKAMRSIGEPCRLSSNFTSATMERVQCLSAGLERKRYRTGLLVSVIVSLIFAIVGAVIIYFYCGAYIAREFDSVVNSFASRPSPLLIIVFASLAALLGIDHAVRPKLIAYFMKKYS